LAAADEGLRRKIKNILMREGFIIIGEAEDGSFALRLIRTLDVDLIILDADLRGIKGMEIAQISREERIAPVVIMSSSWQKDLAEMAGNRNVFAFLLKPIDENLVVPTIETALLNYQKLLVLEEEVAQLKNALETRKLVEKAKGILMKVLNLTEEEAFRRIQRQSMDRCIPMKDVAEAVILSYEMIGDRRRD